MFSILLINFKNNNNTPTLWNILQVFMLIRSSEGDSHATVITH